MAEVTMSEIAEPAEDPLQPYAALIEAIQKPISADIPCGEDVRYNDDFQELKTEIDGIGSLATDVDYERIVELGRTILETKSKDLTTAGFLALGLARTREVEGMAEALVILGALVETFWEPLHPQKPVRRRNALQFVAERLKGWLDLRLEQQKPTEAERAPLEVAHERLKTLQAFTTKELEDKAPALSGLVKSLEAAIRRLPKPKTPAPEPSTQETAPAASSGAPSSAVPVADPSPAPSVLSSPTEAERAIKKAISFLREQDRQHPVPYRLLRVLRWGALEQEPLNENGKTRIPAPRSQRLTYLSGLLEKGSYEQLIEEGEKDFQGTSIYLWLGLQRLVAVSMEALGAPYQDAAEAVMVETALLVRRMPGLVRLTYNDGTLFVDAMTQEWLETRVNALLGEGGGAGAGTSAGSGDSDPIDAQYQEARQKLGMGDLGGALAVMQDGRGQDTSQEDRFRRRLYLAVLCVRGNQPDVARAMLESLDEEVARYTLDAWNPALTLEVWFNLYTCYNTLARAAMAADKASFAESAAQVLDKISRLDAGYALRVLGHT